MDHSMHMQHGDHAMGQDHNMHHGMGETTDSGDSTTSSTMGPMIHMMMAMSFEFSKSGTVLFKDWKFDTVGGLIGSMVGIFFMAALYEGLKYYREYLFWKTYNALQYKAVTLPQKTVVTEENQVVHVVGEVIHKQPPTMLSKMHFFQTFLHMVQMIVSYFLMLIFMTYNTWLCMAVVLGAGVGYFLFGWKKSVIVDVTEHCH